MRKKHHLYIGIIFICLSGCATVAEQGDAPLMSVPVQRNEMTESIGTYEVPDAAEGSLWTDIQGITLFPDKRARKVGDIVIVRIVEDPEAQLDANTKTSRTSGLSASQLEVFGYMKALADRNRRLAQNPGTDNLMFSNLGMSFDGKGTSDRTGHIKAYVSAVVQLVLPNGNLYIKGRREIRVNNETQYLTLSGIIRPEDVSPTNEISSVYIADAKIGYAGAGPVSDKQKPGWLGRVVDHVWPF